MWAGAERSERVGGKLGRCGKVWRGVGGTSSPGLQVEARSHAMLHPPHQPQQQFHIPTPTPTFPHIPPQAQNIKLSFKSLPPSHFSNTFPTGMLVKAVLMGGAVPMQGNVLLPNTLGPDGKGQRLPLEEPPSIRQGFGRLDLSGPLPLANAPLGWNLQVRRICSFLLIGRCRVWRGGLQLCVGRGCCGIDSTRQGLWRLDLSAGQRAFGLESGGEVNMLARSCKVRHLWCAAY